MLNLRCPACRQRIQASEAVLGKTLLCPSCGGSFPVNLPAADPRAATAAPMSPPKADPAPRLRPPTPPVLSHRAVRSPEPTPQPAPRPAPAPARAYALPPEPLEPYRPANRPAREPRRSQTGPPPWVFAVIGCAGCLSLIFFIALIRFLTGFHTVASQSQPPLPDLAPVPAPAPATASVPGGGATLSTAQIVARCEPSVAMVKGKVSSGTGFLVRRNLIATNAHVIDDEFLSDLEIRFPSAPSGYQGPLRAELLYEDPKRDLAFLAISSGLPALEVAPSYRFVKGEDVIAIGNPGLGGEVVMENAVNRGVMSSKTVIDGQDFLQMGIAINHGNSGGPVFDSAGRVIGVATLKAAKAESMGFCIPVEDVHAALGRLDAQPGSARAAMVSRDRSRTAFKALTTAGALYTVRSYIRAVMAAGGGAAGDSEIAEVAKGLDEALAHLDQQFSQFDHHLAGIRSDRALADAARRNYDDLAINYRAIRDLSDHPIQPPVQHITRARNLASQHARLVRAMESLLGISVPRDLIALLEKSPAEAGPPPEILVQVMPNPNQGGPRRRGPGPQAPMGPRFGPRGPGFNPGQDMQRRMQQMQQQMRNRMRAMQPHLGP